MNEEIKDKAIVKDLITRLKRLKNNPRELKEKIKVKAKKIFQKTIPCFREEKSRLAGKFALGLLAGLILVFILISVIFGFGLYKYNWNDPVTNKIIKIIPYPAILVNYKPISYAKFRDDLGTLTHYYKKQEELSGGATGMPSADEIKNNVLDQIIDNEILEEVARYYKINVGNDEIEKEFGKVVAEAGGEAQVEDILQNLYQWQPEDFKEKVLEPFLLQQKLAEAVSADPVLNREARKKAEEVLKLVKAGQESFENLAQKYSDDPGSAGQGGDLGFFGRGVMIKEFEDTAFTLEPGKSSDLIKTQYGYHIIKVEEKKTDGDSKEEQVRARHILIKTKDLDQILEEQRERAKIYKFI